MSSLFWCARLNLEWEATPSLVGLTMFPCMRHCISSIYNPRRKEELRDLHLACASIHQRSKLQVWLTAHLDDLVSGERLDFLHEALLCFPDQSLALIHDQSDRRRKKKLSCVYLHQNILSPIAASLSATRNHFLFCTQTLCVLCKECGGIHHLKGDTQTACIFSSQCRIDLWSQFGWAFLWCITVRFWSREGCVVVSNLKQHL